MGLKEDLEYNRKILGDSISTKSYNSGQPEFYQYQWDLQEKNPKYDPRGTSEQPIFKYTLQDQSPNSVIKDVVDETGKKVGAYNTQTGFKYGLTNPDLVKNQNDIVSSQSPGSNVNQIVNSVMNNSLLTSPTPVTIEKRNYISPEDVAKMNPQGENTIGKIIGGTIGGLAGGAYGLAAGGIASVPTGPAWPVITGAGTLAGAVTGYNKGLELGGDIGYFAKGLGETFNERFSNFKKQNEGKTLFPRQQ